MGCASQEQLRSEKGAKLRQRVRVPTHVCPGIGFSLVSDLENFL